MEDNSVNILDDICVPVMEDNCIPIMNDNCAPISEHIVFLLRKTLFMHYELNIINNCG